MCILIGWCGWKQQFVCCFFNPVFVKYNKGVKYHRHGSDCNLFWSVCVCSSSKKYLLNLAAATDYFCRTLLRNKVAWVLNTFLTAKCISQIFKEIHASPDNQAPVSIKVSLHIFVEVSREATAHISDVWHIQQQHNAILQVFLRWRGSGPPQAPAIPDADRLVS